MPDLLLIGENGLSVQLGVDLPPKEYFTLPLPEGCTETLDKIRELGRQQFAGRVWEQTNEVAVSFLFPEGELNDEFHEFVKRHQSFLEAGKVTAIEQKDALIFNLSVSIGFCYLSGGALGCDRSAAYAVGDSYNDYPMFQACGHSIGIQLPDREAAEYAVRDIRGHWTFGAIVNARLAARVIIKKIIQVRMFYKYSHNTEAKVCIRLPLKYVGPLLKSGKNGLALSLSSYDSRRYHQQKCRSRCAT